MFERIRATRVETTKSLPGGGRSRRALRDAAAAAPEPRPARRSGARRASAERIVTATPARTNERKGPPVLVDRRTSGHPGLAGAPLDAFIPHPDVRERFHTTVRAPAPIVMNVATQIDLRVLPLTRTVFRLREVLMHAAPARPRKPQGLLAETQSLGCGTLLEEPGRLVVCGATCRPWLADVGFTPIPPEAFAAYAEPDQVKIAWTLEAEPLGPALTRFSHETRVMATDSEARAKFVRYWRWARFGIVGIRLLLLPAIGREAERIHAVVTQRARRSAHPAG